MQNCPYFTERVRKSVAGRPAVRPSDRQPYSIHNLFSVCKRRSRPRLAARRRSIRAVDLAAKPLPLRSQQPAAPRAAGGGGAEPNRRASAGSPSGRFTSLSFSISDSLAPSISLVARFKECGRQRESVFIGELPSAVLLREILSKLYRPKSPKDTNSRVLRQRNSPSSQVFLRDGIKVVLATAR